MLYLQKENRCLHKICHNSIAIYILSMHQLLNGWLAESLTTVDNYFTGVVNTTSTPTGWEGGGGWVATK